MNEGTAKSWQDDELSPRLQASPESKNCQSLAERKSEGITDASTQTEEKAVERGVSINDGSHQNQVSQVEENAGPGEADTLESLIRADVRKLNSFRMLEGEGFQMPSNTKLKIINMMIQLISCGSIQEKDHRIGLIANYRPRISSANFSTLGELDHLPENPRLMGTRFADKKGSLGEKMVLERDVPTDRYNSLFCLLCLKLCCFELTKPCGFLFPEALSRMLMIRKKESPQVQSASHYQSRLLSVNS